MLLNDEIFNIIIKYYLLENDDLLISSSRRYLVGSVWRFCGVCLTSVSFIRIKWGLGDFLLMCFLMYMSRGNEFY